MRADSDRTAEVLKLGLVDGLSIRAIARRLSMARRTVRRLLGRQLPARQAREPRPSALDPYLSTIKVLLEEAPELTSPAMLERLRPLGYRGGVSILRDRMKALRGSRPREAFLTLHFHPGEAVQVDWADFGFAIPGCPRRVSAFIMALCHSRYLYLEFTLSQAMPTFLRCLERGLRFYGGTTVADIFDNMKTVVLRPGPPPVFNRRFLAYAGARGFAVRACNPGRGNEKGRVERPVGFVRSRFWSGRRFASLLDLNAQAFSWRDDFANDRVHEVTGKVPSLVFEAEERRLLRPAPSTPFDTDEVEPALATKALAATISQNTALAQQDFALPDGKSISRSGCAALVVAIEATGLRHLHDVAVHGPMDRARLKTVHGERAMAAAPVVVLQVVADKLSQMPLVEDDDMVEALPADSADEPLGEGVLPGSVASSVGPCTSQRSPWRPGCPAGELPDDPRRAPRRVGHGDLARPRLNT